MTFSHKLYSNTAQTNPQIGAMEVLLFARPRLHAIGSKSAIPIQIAIQIAVQIAVQVTGHLEVRLFTVKALLSAQGAYLMVSIF